MLPPASVIVPTYARPDHVRACVRTLLELDYPRERLEIIVVDDGSPHPVDLGAVAEGPARLRVVHQNNAGPARARNRGAQEAAGEVLAFTDDDCRPDPDWLLHLVEAVRREPDTLVGGHTVNALRSNLLAEASQTLVDFLYQAFPTTRQLRPFFTSNNLAASREAFLRLGGFDESFRYSAGEDRDLGERWAGRGSLRYVPAARVRHHHSMTPWGFWRQHHFYGRGAAHLAQRRRSRGEPPPSPESLSFYARMLAFPYEHHGVVRATVLAGLLAVSQAATLSGILSELWRRERQADLGA